MTTIKLPATIWLPNPADLPRLFQDTDRPYLYADTSGIDMTPNSWVRLQEIELTFGLDEALRPAPEPIPAPASDVAATQQPDLLQEVDDAPDEGTLP